mmetsp:Transcript_2357/g.6674  ORF Transcript_2357/g.6674 Transcript_2357/m.6674 type:complete len:487 (-) Transcript_2357:1317-2777(-)
MAIGKTTARQPPTSISDGITRDAGAGVLSGSVAVVVRVRCLVAGEPGEQADHAGGATLLVHTHRQAAATAPDTTARTREKVHTYAFERVHPPSDDNHIVFSASVEPLVRDALSGRQCACFAYGYTGTGKSTTVYGSATGGGGNAKGVAVLAAELYLQAAGNLGAGYGVRVSMCEVAGKECRDLLADGAPLKVRTAGNGGVYVRRAAGNGGITRRFVSSAADFEAAIAEGVASRRVGSSTVHDASSRSHAVIEMEVATAEVIALEEELGALEARSVDLANTRDADLKRRYAEASAGMRPEEAYVALRDTQLGRELEALGEFQTELSDQVDAVRRRLEAAVARDSALRGRLAFVDMAGNDWEKAEDVQSKQQRAEHAEINSSLLAVKECLRAVAATAVRPAVGLVRPAGGAKRGVGASRPPYRNSVHTHLLSRFFTPAARLLMVTTITPSTDERLTRQTVNTLNYAQLVAPPAAPVVVAAKVVAATTM